VIVTPGAPVPEKDPANTGVWKPAPHTTEIRPLPAPPDKKNGATLEKPEPMEQPPAPETPKGTDDFPADIPQFNLVYDKVASGQQPFPDGFNWLKEKGYRTVLHLRAPDEDNTAIKTEVESKGMKYLSLEVSPKTLTREKVFEFSRILADQAGHPLFVFDRKGSIAGPLWYLHLRLTENKLEMEALPLATRLGLKEETAGANTDWWLAINQVLRGS
jgi:protein tyrosine phosphatase (PTP) superfamily phosphohydrolase (DUF442 family)